MAVIRAAKETDFDSVKDITQTTIWSVYPKYYPSGAVQFFSNHHSDDRIRADIVAGIVFLIEVDGTAIGTVTVADNEINRLFVLPDFQRKPIRYRLFCVRGCNGTRLRRLHLPI